MISIAFGKDIQLLSIEIIAEYNGKIYDETKQKIQW